MAQRDYVGRGQTAARRKKTTKSKGKSASKGLPLTTLIVAIAIVALFIGGLYFITHNKKETAETTPSLTGQAGQHPANNLPPKPQERWQYIKELENRQVSSPLQPYTPPTGSQISPNSNLSPEQLRFLQQIEADKRQPAVQLPEVRSNGEVPRSQVVVTPPPTTLPPITQQVAPKTAEQAPAPTQTKPVAENRFMVQCGSFKNTEQAESVRATLAFAGVESRVTKGSDGWIRVLSGPYSKDQANSLRRQADGAGISGCILRSSGG